ncbi:MAG: YdbH domain-containing protein [Croceibacterium sp.]
MAEDAAIEAPPVSPRRRRTGWWAAIAVLVVLAASLTFVWLARERIAGNVIGGELDKLGIHATYQIERIGTRDQVLRDVVIGNPAHPDLTIERAVVRINPRFGVPTVGRISLTRPRLFGIYRKGVLSFGELDPLLFRKTAKKRFELPDLDLAIEDGRALVETTFGPLAAKLTGRGNLRDGFAGELAAIAPQLAVGGCGSGRTTLYGRLSTARRRPRFAGPLRFDRLHCPDSRAAVSGGALLLQLTADEPLRKFDGRARLALGAAEIAGSRMGGAEGTSKFTWRDEGLTANFQLTGRGFQSAPVNVARLGLNGTLRARRSFDRLELETALDGTGLRLGSGLDAALGSAVRAARDTLLAPLLAQVRAQLAREGRGSALSGQLTLRRTGARVAVVVPSVTVQGSSGRALLQVSRFQLSDGPGAAPEYSGSFATGGPGLPRIVGTLELRGAGGVQGRLAMAEYAAGGSRLAIPELVLVQRRDAAIGFAGTARASGPLPAGRAENLLLPITGNRTADGQWVLWQGCAPVSFDRLQYANLTLERQALTLCPQRGAPILRYGPGGLRLAVGAPSLRLTGRLGQTPIAIRSGPVGFAYPGTLSARQVDVALGPPATAQRFLISGLTARVGKDIAGRFEGTDVRLFSVPLDVHGASGNWRYAGGRLTLSEGDFRLVDRQSPARFEPLVARGASLALENNLITAQAVLREPKGGREVTAVVLRHSLVTGRGRADLAVAGLDFGPGFQPLDLTQIAYGKVSNVRGKVRGTGVVEWGPGGVTSTGRFSSTSLDFAAPFGPVKGASGTIEFTDLIGLTTAPGQRIHVASVNPGIEVTDGDVLLSLKSGQILAVEAGTWPFLGGTLTLRPVIITFGAAEERHYVLEVNELDAARFIDRMELANLSATGIFDGTLPIVFDAKGDGKIVNGLLASRPPGGNLAYVGDLTYKDLSTMANMAFGALRSLNYREMTIAMNGDLTGEIVTRVRFDGVSQGKGATKNVVTRALAGLPLRFDVNIRAQFYQLISSIRAMYDPSAIKDPRTLGLLDAQGNVIRRETTAVPPVVKPNNLSPDEAPIQPRESEKVR